MDAIKRLSLKKNLKFYLLGLFMFTVMVAFFYSIITNPPVGSTHNQMKMMKRDMEKLLSEKNTIVWHNAETGRSGAASLLMIVSPAGWGNLPLPSDERLLKDMGWNKLAGFKNIFCKEKIKLSFEPGTYNNQGSMNIVMRYNKDTVMECNSLS